jgi:small subunit ribosomal protein S21
LVTVKAHEGESQEQLLSRFRRKVIRSRILSEVRQKRWYISKSELKRINKKKAIRRLRRHQNNRRS